VKLFTTSIMGLVAMAGFSVPACAEDKPKEVTVLFDARTDVLKGNNGAPISVIKGLGDDQCNDIDTAVPPATLDKKLIGECDVSRYISNKGDLVKVVAYYSTASDKLPVINFKETKRKTQVGDDLSVIWDFAKKSRDKSGLVEHDSVEKTYKLKNDRSTLEVSLSYATEESDKESSSSVTLITGDTEHWFASIDVPLSSADELKYDSATSQLVEKEVPSSYYIGFNYMIGDVLSDDLSWTDKLTGKIMLKASSRPLESVGLGLGYRLNELKFGSKKLGSTMFFVGSFWDKEDKLDGAVVKEDEKYSQNWRIGISFGLDKLSEWTK